jgi:hypothetical protein
MRSFKLISAIIEKSPTHDYDRYNYILKDNYYMGKYIKSPDEASSIFVTKFLKESSCGRWEADPPFYKYYFDDGDSVFTFEEVLNTCNFDPDEYEKLMDF